MEPRKLRSVETKPSGGGTVRTDTNPRIGGTTGSGFFVDFQILYEVHGGFHPGDQDNASLLAIQVVPSPKNPERQFRHLKVSLWAQSTVEDEDKPYIVSFEPASKTSELLDVYTTDHERQRMTQATAEIPIMSTASVGGQMSVTNTSRYTRTHLLRVKGIGERFDSLLPSRQYDGATWNIHAANEDQGVGDSLTVALLIKRPEGASFQLFGKVVGDIAGWSGSAHGFINSITGQKTEPIGLGRFPLDRSNTPLPPNILVNDLHKASTDNVLRGLQEVGLYLPELARPVKSSQDAISATSFEISAMKGVGTDNAPAIVASATATTATSTADRVMAHGVGIPTTVANNETRLASSAATATLTSLVRDLSVLTDGLRQQAGLNAVPNTSRIRRHREMANLYERLAELHRDEAKELQLFEEAVHRTVVDA